LFLPLGVVFCIGLRRAVSAIRDNLAKRKGVAVDLSSVDAKLAWAEQHFATLKSGVDAFLKDERNSILLDGNADATKYVVRAVIPEMPDTQRWGLIFGDFVHCLRSALDHLLYAISVDELKADPPPNERKIMMLLKRSEQGFRDARYRIEDLGPEVQARVESLQPYPGSNNLLLGLLDDLDIRDKHRLLNVILVGLDEAIGLISGLIPGQECQIDASRKPLEDQTPIFTLTLDRPNPDVKVEGSLFIGVGLSEVVGAWGEIRSPIELGDEMLAEVRRAISVICGS
jgi:hypothetical protein